MSCRFCEAEVEQVLDLGKTPPANSLLDTPNGDQDRFPLVLEWCRSCNNVQLRDCLTAEELYSNYLYVTPQSTMLSDHYEKLRAFLSQGGYLASDSGVMEIGSNAGLFLKSLQPHVRSVIGIDPAREIAEEANAAGIPTVVDFFNRESATAAAEQYGRPDIVIARHCMAHNEWPQEMVRGAAAALGDSGYLVIENAYVMNTLQNTEFDQIYHEHMYYFSISSLEKMLAKEGFTLVDATFSLIHGGSIVVVAERGDAEPRESVTDYRAREELFLSERTFASFRERAETTRGQLVELVHKLASDGQRIYTYGATAKGNTLLNFAGLTNKQIPFCVDSTPVKQGKFLPGSGCEVISEESVGGDPPDYFLLTAWNYKDEIISKVRNAGNYDSKFIIPIPFVSVV